MQGIPRNTDNATDGGIFQRVAKLAGMTDACWNTVSPQIPGYPNRLLLLRQLLIDAGAQNTVLFFFGDYVLLQYGKTISYQFCSLQSISSSGNIPGKNEVVDPSAILSSDTIRNIFVMLEALVYKCVHINLKRNSTEYHEKSETYEIRMEQLVDKGFLTKKNQLLGRDLYQTRCQFAHSIQTVNRLNYMGKPLNERWRANGLKKHKRYFLTDVFKFTENLLKVFRKVQSKQINCEKFMESVLKFKIPAPN